MKSVGGQDVRDITALLRCARLAPYVALALRSQRAVCPRLVAAYDSVVAPLVDVVRFEAATAEGVHRALCGAGTKYGYVMYNFAQMAGARFSPDVAVLAGSFARLYDDLMDEVDDASFDSRLVDLLLTAVPAANDHECLLVLLFQALYERLDSRSLKGLHAEFTDLHAHQRGSRAQKDEATSDEALRDITYRKAGLAATVLFGLVKSPMNVEERKLVMQVGEIIQLIDDHLDVADDRRVGISTLASRGYPCLTIATAKLRTLHPSLSAHYGRGKVRGFIGMLYGLMLMAVLGRRQAFRRPQAYPGRRPASPARVLLGRGVSTFPSRGPG